jgi:penicillin-binding protein 1A
MPKPAAKTLLDRVTQLLPRSPQRARFTGLEVTGTACVPTLIVEDGGQSVRYPLLGDHYRLGRGSQCDIRVSSGIVSQQHLTLNRDSQLSPDFWIQDDTSTNGTFWQGKRVAYLELRPGDQITLGPPQLKESVRLRYERLLPPRQLGLKRLVVGSFVLVGVLVTAVAIGGSGVSVRSLARVQGPIAAYDGDNQPLQTLRSSSHVELSRLSEFSPYLPKALLASEDSRFYWHIGLDPIGLARAVVMNVRGGEIREGASTLTQQIARSLYPEYVGTGDSLGRKLREAVVALKLEAVYSKDFLLRTYLNRVYLGVGYGFEDAARQYFNKSAKQLTLGEAATLVGLLPSPNGFSPCNNLESAMDQRNGVLKRMRELGSIGEAEYQEARRSTIVIDRKSCQTEGQIASPYYYQQVIAELDNLLGQDVTQEGNFIVDTSLNARYQKLAEQQLRRFLSETGRSVGLEQGAIVTLDTRTGAILALVGGADYQQSQFNRAIQAYRQPGSTFKIFAYATALEQGVPASKAYSCAPLNWMGQTFKGCERIGGSRATLNDALAQSENAVALRLSQEVGLEQVVATARRLGVEGKLEPVPGLILGQYESTLLAMTNAFAALANEGRLNRPHAIQRLYDSNQCTKPGDRPSCRLVYAFEQSPDQDRPVLKPETTATLTEMLRGAVSRGTGRAAAIGWGEAGKTGTTNNGVDLWFIGYVPSRHLVTGVWLGNDDNRPTQGSSALAARLWSDYMARILT